jgi:hypothetical protein
MRAIYTNTAISNQEVMGAVDGDLSWRNETYKRVEDQKDWHGGGGRCSAHTDSTEFVDKPTPEFHRAKALRAREAPVN